MSSRDEWMADGLCRQVDNEPWFPEQGGSALEAKKICFRCDVREQCLQYALANEERFGVWGGLSERERRRLKPKEPSRLGKPRVDLTPEQEQVAAAMFATGATRSEVGTEIGMSWRAVDRFVAKLNQNGAAA